jgi:hypothetical protein
MLTCFSWHLLLNVCLSLSDACCACCSHYRRSEDTCGPEAQQLKRTVWRTLSTVNRLLERARTTDDTGGAVASSPPIELYPALSSIADTHLMFGSSSGDSVSSNSCLQYLVHLAGKSFHTY